jgi:hypothetical protein
MLKRGAGGGAARIVAAAVLCVFAVASFIDGDVFTGVVALGCAVLLMTMWASVGARMAAAAVLCLLIPGTIIGDASNGQFARGAMLSGVALGCAVWLVVTLPWSRRSRVAAAVATVAGTIALLFVVGFLVALAFQGN